MVQAARAESSPQSLLRGRRSDSSRMISASKWARGEAGREWELRGWRLEVAKQ